MDSERDRGESGINQPASAFAHTLLAAPRSAAPAEGPGTIVGSYKILQLIGEGGFGSVFMAQQDQPVRRTVALKIIKLGMDTRQVVARFEQERQALAVMDHANIAKVLDAGATATGRPYFVMELVKGEPITEYCDKNNLAIAERLELFAQVCNAVQHAHSKGIIHRDIKPSNILVSAQDGRPLAKVIDFGIAKATAARLTEKTLFTEQRTLIGTPEYMSPEQAEGSMDIDTRTDVYALGVLLYELLTGATPFDGEKLRSAAYGEMQRIIREVDPPNPSTRLSQNTATIGNVAAHRHTEPRKLGSIIRGELDWIVMKALEKDRQRRYETANGLAMDIQRYLTGEPVLAAPPSASYRFRKFVKRHRGAVAAGSAIAASLILGIIAFAWQAQVAREQRDRAKVAEDQASRRAAELQQVANYQEKMLQQVDPTTAGMGLMNDLMGRHAAALERNKVEEPDRSARIAALERELHAVNVTDAAAAFLDRNVLAPAVRTIDSQFADQPTVDATLRTTLGTVYDNLGRYSDALALYEKAYERRAKTLGENNHDTLMSRGGIGNMQGELQRLPEAEANVRATLAGLQQLLGDDAPETLDAKALLATQMSFQGKYDEAEKLARDVLQRRERVLGPDHRDTVTAKAMLGRYQMHRGEYDDAVTLLNDAAEAQRRTNDTALGGTLNYLGVALMRKNDRPAAEHVLREALALQRERLGEDHPVTLAAISSLASLLMDLDQLPEAETLARENLDQCLKTMGREHANTLKAMNILGQVYFRQNKYTQTEPLYREALETGRRVLGEDHPDTIIWIANMGVVLHRLGRTVEAEPYYYEAMEKNRRVLGLTHPYTTTTTRSLGDLLRQQGKAAQAEPIYRAAVEDLRRIEGEDHPDYANMLGSLGSVLRDQGKLDEAETCYLQGLAISRRLNGEDHQTTITAILRLATVQVARGKYAQTIDLLMPIEPKVQTAIPGMVGVLRHASLLGLVGKSRLGLATTPADFAAAEASLLETQATFEKNRGPNDRETLEWVQAMADLYSAWDKAQPGVGHDAKAIEWQAKLPATSPN